MSRGTFLQRLQFGDWITCFKAPGSVAEWLRNYTYSWTVNSTPPLLCNILYLSVAYVYKCWWRWVPFLLCMQEIRRLSAGYDITLLNSLSFSAITVLSNLLFCAIFVLSSLFFVPFLSWVIYSVVPFLSWEIYSFVPFLSWVTYSFVSFLSRAAYCFVSLLFSSKNIKIFYSRFRAVSTSLGHTIIFNFFLIRVFLCFVNFNYLKYHKTQNKAFRSRRLFALHPKASVQTTVVEVLCP